MKCCEKCKDRLKIPEGAILKAATVKVAQSFPFICRQKYITEHNSIQPITHKVIGVKEYQVLEPDQKIFKKCSTDYTFQKYVEIIINGNFGDVSAYQVRYSSQRTGGTEILSKYDSEQIPRIEHDNAAYYTISNTQIKIFTKHFSLYLIDYNPQNMNALYDAINKSEPYAKLKKIADETVDCKSREVDLVAEAYFVQPDTYNKHTLSLYVYARDKNIDSNNTLPINIGGIQYVPLIPLPWTLDNPPEVIRKETKFQCVAVLEKQSWKENISEIVSSQLNTILFFKIP